MTVLELKEAILRFSVEQRAGLNRLLCGWEDDEWDTAIASDAEGDVWTKSSSERKQV